jgi:acyl-CoA thioester hydrolase
MAVAAFRHIHRVTYADCTLGDHVYYARYLEWLEAARNEFFRSLDSSFLAWQAQDTMFPIVECRLRYRAPARYDDVLAIEVWPTRVEGVRLNFAHRILNQIEALVLEAETFHVCAGLNEKPKRLPEALASRLRPCLRPADTAS